MSEVVHYTGKLVRVERKDHKETFDQQCERLAKEIDSKSEANEYYNWQDVLMDLTEYEKYVVYGDSLYEIKDLSLHENDDDIAIAKKINGKAFEFEVKFYNGGTSLDEMIIESLDKLK